MDVKKYSAEYKRFSERYGKLSYAKNAQHIFTIIGIVKQPEIKEKERITYFWNGINVTKINKVLLEQYDEKTQKVVRFSEPKIIISYDIYDVGSDTYTKVLPKVTNSYMLFLLKKDIFNYLNIDIEKYYEANFDKKTGELR